jgi:hypothetical protein
MGIFFKVATSYNKNVLQRHYAIYAFLLRFLYICYRDKFLSHLETCLKNRETIYFFLKNKVSEGL